MYFLIHQKAQALLAAGGDYGGLVLVCRSMTGQTLLLLMGIFVGKNDEKGIFKQQKAKKYSAHLRICKKKKSIHLLERINILL